MITDTDRNIVLHSVESYLTTLGRPSANNPKENLVMYQMAQETLYSEIARRAPRIAQYIASVNVEEDDIGKALLFAMSQHALDPIYVRLQMMYLEQMRNPTENALIGALFMKIMQRYIQLHWKEPKAPKKGETVEEPNNDMKEIDHLRSAVHSLLGDTANLITARTGNINFAEAISIAGLISLNNKDTIKEIIKSDFPITAGLFDIVQDPTQLLQAALLLEKSEFPKTTTNQAAFIESMKRWVYDKLNKIPTQQSYQFLLATYGSMQPDVSKYLIQIKECGTTFSNLLQVAKQMVNN
jgi:hypothetical protein